MTASNEAESASSIVEADVERIFFRKLVSDGISVKIESNRETED